MTVSDDYESGPFCRHWSDPADCDEQCANCEHICREHEFEYPGECAGDNGNCYCEEWED